MNKPTKTRINEQIRCNEVRVIDEEGTQLGIMRPYDAMKMAQERDLDLVEVAPQAAPPVCRIMNFGKYQYQMNKRMQEARRNQKQIQLKEVKFRPRIDDHDYEFKKNNIIRFLHEGNKTKAVVMFRGREMTHTELGRELLQRLIEDLGEVAEVEKDPRQEGNLLTVILAPGKKSKTVGLKKKKEPASPPSPVAAPA